jgi:hypothetical protein
VFRGIIWERLICLAGLAMAVIGYLALAELRMPYSREPLPGLPADTFGFARAAGLAMAVIGGFGWLLAVREARSDRSKVV